MLDRLWERWDSHTRAQPSAAYRDGKRFCSLLSKAPMHFHAKLKSLIPLGDIYRTSDGSCALCTRHSMSLY
ncbi:hypothetical protein VTO42DRAFT_6240 [Malbranchea cinnamomea]